MKKNISTKFARSVAIASCLIVIFLLTSPAIAVPLNDVNKLANDNGLAKYGTFKEVLQLVLQGLLSLAMVVAIIFVVISGYQMVTAQGNEEQITAAKKNLTWAIIGIIVIAASWFILSLITKLIVTGNP